MTKPTEKIPLRFFIRPLQPEIGEDEDASKKDSFDLNKSLEIKLKSIYKVLWKILAEFATHRDMHSGRVRLVNRCFYEAQEIAGHPNVFLRCEVADNKRLALILEQTIKDPSFVGKAGLVLGAHGRISSSRFREMRTNSMVGLTVLASPRLYYVFNSTLQSHADDFLAKLIASPLEISRVHDWFEETEKVVTVPEDSLRGTTQWLSEVNLEMAAERLASQTSADAQNDAFMRSFATIAGPRFRV